MKTMWTIGLVAVVSAATVSASYAQQSSPPPAVDSTPRPATDYSIAAPGTTAQGSTQPEFAGEGGEVPAGQPAGAAGSELDRDAVSAPPANQFQNEFPAPSNAQRIAPRTLGTQPEFGNGQGIANQRGELGVWLVPSGGPGVRIRRITEGSAAQQAGLQPGDVILQVNGQGATSATEVAEMVRDMPAGQVARIQYWRNGELQEVDVALQPAREYRAAYRGPDNEMNESFRMDQGGGDLEVRMTRLERQLATVMEDLRIIRQHLAQRDLSGSATTAAGAAGLDATGSAATGFDAPATPGSDAATPGATTTPADGADSAAMDTDAADENNPFGSASDAGATEPATTAPATEPEATLEAQPAEDAAGAEDDFFDAGAPADATATETETTDAERTDDAAATEDEAASEEAPAEDASDDLFQ